MHVSARVEPYKKRSYQLRDIFGNTEYCMKAWLRELMCGRCLRFHLLRKRAAGSNHCIWNGMAVCCAITFVEYDDM